MKEECIMNVVAPIKDKRSINKMKKSLSKGRFGERNVLIFSIGINTAYRISDLRYLKLSDVLTIKNKNKIVVKDRLALKEQKTGKYNSIILSNQLREDIWKYTVKNFPEYLDNLDLAHYLFPSGKGLDKPMNRQTLWAILNCAANENGIPNIGSHSMRKTFGYFLYKNKVSIEIIQELLNHSSQKDTLRYIGITQEDKDLAVINLNL